MKRARFLFFLLAALAIPSILAAQPVEIGQRAVVTSEVLHEDRGLMIALPESYHGSSFRYPVLYLLDADSDFLHTAAIVEFMARTDQVPELIIVGITNTNRSRDLTPPSGNEEETVFWDEVGGADQFRRFLAEELIPFVDNEFRTAPYRIIRGQSFGGLFSIHDYMSGSPTFQAYSARTSWPANWAYRTWPTTRRRWGRKPGGGDWMFGEAADPSKTGPGQLVPTDPAPRLSVAL